MQLTGRIASWNDERGFGFITPAHGGADVFVHIRDVASGRATPCVGEAVTYTLVRGSDGRPRAERVVRAAFGATAPVETRVRERRPARTGMVSAVLFLLLAGAAMVWGYQHLAAGWHRRALASQPAAPALSEPLVPSKPPAFACDGRTRCSQMTSCAEAKWFINHCPGTAMDGNHDGVPCETPWCN